MVPGNVENWEESTSPALPYGRVENVQRSIYESVFSWLKVRSRSVTPLLSFQPSSLVAAKGCFRRKYLSKLTLVFLLIFFTVSALHGARQIRLNLGTIAPRGSSAHKALMTMREKWSEAPGGGVRLVIYPDGVQGGEADMVRLMRVGMLQAGLFTATGLSDIEGSVQALQNMPMVFQDLGEYDYVGGILRPKLARRLEEKGFIVLFWIDAGWIRIFSKEHIVHPDDLRKLKWFVWEGNNEQAKIMRSIGFQPVMLETAEIIPGLQTGLIDAVAAPPIFALAGQLDTRAPYMLDLDWAPLQGAAIVTKSSWLRISDSTKPTLLAAAAIAGAEINLRARKESYESVNAMQKRGLKVENVTSEIEAEWRREAERVYPQIRGRMVPNDIFDEVLELLKRYRSDRVSAEH